MDDQDNPNLSQVEKDWSWAGGPTLQRFYEQERAKEALEDTHPSRTGAFACWGCRKPVRPLPIRFNVMQRNEMKDDILLAMFCGNECMHYNWPQVRTEYCLAGGEPQEHPLEEKEKDEGEKKEKKDAAKAEWTARQREEANAARRGDNDDE